MIDRNKTRSHIVVPSTTTAAADDSVGTNELGDAKASVEKVSCLPDHAPNFIVVCDGGTAVPRAALHAML